MSCITLSAHNTTMATTQVTRAASRSFCWPRLEEQKAERTPVRMNWVVVTDENGNRQLRSVWHADWEG
jgi:hypothetical protein